MADDNEELRMLSVNEVRRLFGLSSKTIRKLEADPDMCFPKKIATYGHKHYLFVELRDWQHDMQIQSESVKLDFHGNKKRAAE